jgi:carboxyl-terminal processing protease
MTGIDGILVRQKILGPAGSQLKLTIKRIGVADPFDVTLTRAVITSSNIISKMLDNNIAYVQLLTFGDIKTTNDLRAALKKLLAENPKGLILDLRNNGGGLLDSAVDVASEFLPNGIVAYEVYGDGRQHVYQVKSGGLATEIPLVVLVNEGSASASEIVAGAIQDQKRGTLIGVTTYGKGSVQLWNELVNDEGAVRITIAKWLTPNKRTIHGIGLTPDYIVENDPEAYQNGIDLQLNKAIDLLLSE